MNDTPPSAHIKRLTRMLMISGAFNVLLIACFFYFLVRENVPRPYFELKPAEEREQLPPLALESSNKEIIKHLRALSMAQLTAKLTDTRLVENGYTERDLALSALVTFYNFDLNKALAGKTLPTQQRKISFGKTSEGAPVEVIVYPSMTEDQFQAIVHFAKTEKWPLTSRGLFVQLRKPEYRSDHTLVEAFLLTPEYIAVETLFSRAEVRVTKKELLDVILEGNWKTLSAFYEQQKSLNDLSPARRQQFLLSYIDLQSKAAAALLLKTDGVFAVSKLDDKRILALLTLVDEKTPLTEKFSLILLTSPRGDAVWQAAALKLYAFAGEAPPENDLHNAALTRFTPQPNLMKVAANEKAVKSKTPVLPQTAVIDQSMAVAKPNAQPVTLPAKKTSTQLAKPAAQKPLTSKSPTPTSPTSTSKAVAKPTTPKALAPASKPQIKTKNVAMAGKGQKVQYKRYVVVEGDSLWKISRRCKVDVATLKKLNRLESDFLKPGTVLQLPTGIE